MDIIYRNFISEDIDQIIKFWNENSGWETTMNRDEFNLRFCSSPWGQPIMMLAIDNDVNEIVGLFCFLPLSVNINNNEEKCYRPFGAVFKESFRSKFGLTSFLTNTHPIQKLYKKGTEIALRQDAVLTYLIPDPRWGRILKTMPFVINQFPLWSLTLPLVNDFDFNHKTVVKKLETTDTEIERLWMESSKGNLCTLTRNTNFYKWKINLSHGRFKLKGVFNEHKLIGLFTIDFKASEHQWLICDLLTLNNKEALKYTLQAACQVVQVEYGEKEIELDKAYKVAILATPLIEEKIKGLGFCRDNYSFNLAVQLLDKKRFSKAEVEPQNWYISAND